MDSAAILKASALTLARAIAERRVTSRAVVDAHIAKARAVNPALNAIVRDRFAEATAEADAVDARISGGARDLPPLAGVPCTIKEAFALTGMPNSSGLWSRREVVADRDAVAVARLREAGAIPIGVTNISELCMWMESANAVWGRTSNAYDSARTAGGSSGGEGAIVGAGASPFGLGSDVGGSIRMPAFFNGVFGHKPTGGTVPSDGHFPPSKGKVELYNTMGPIARRAEDLMPLLRIMAAREVGDPSTVELRRLRVLDVRGDGLMRVAPPLLAAQARAAEALAARGATVVRREIPRFKRALEIWSAMLHEGGGEDAPYRSILAGGQPFHGGRELLLSIVGRSRHTFPGVALALLDQVPSRFPGMTRRSVELGHELSRELGEILQDDAVMLYPSHPVIAPRHRVPMFIPIRWIYTAIFNVMELPSTQVPLGLDARGLPLGVQVVGPRGLDHFGIACAVALEQDLGGWVAPARFA